MIRYEKSTGDIVIDGFELGIARSPHNGIANLKNVNISTENKEVLLSYPRVQESQAAISGTFTYVNTSTVSSSTGTLRQGSWVTVGAGITGLSAGNYYVLEKSGTNYVLSTKFSVLDSDKVTGMSAGSALFNTNVFNMGLQVATATEPYFDSSGNQQYRYYVLDIGGLVWVHDTTPTSLPTTPLWFLPDPTPVGSYASGVTTASGIAVLNGFLFVFAGNKILCKPTVKLDDVYSTTSFYGGNTCGTLDNKLPHFAFTAESILYYTDGRYIGSIFPNTSIGTTASIPNIQSYGSYTAVTTTGTISSLISGSVPTTGIQANTDRIPIYLFTATGGTKPTVITVGTKYYCQYSVSANTFEIYAAPTGGPAIDIGTGSAGTQYFNTFYPAGSDGGTTMTFTPQALTLPYNETAQCISEIGNNLLIGTRSNIVYPWNQVDPTAQDKIFIPENNAVNIITVNNMGYIFAGNKGNIYITNGSTASAVITVPDYCAGKEGTPSTYIEPYFTWGGAMYLKGRVYFSILDQTASKTGQCGGVWSFVPTQNLFFGDDTGLALRQENQSSYGTYSGVSTLLIPNQNQVVKSPQYWSAWYSSVTNPLYGIDNTESDTNASMLNGTIETDLIPVGTMLDKKTFQQIEYKVASPLVSGEGIVISYRQNSTDSYVTCGTAVVESATGLSGYYSAVFEKSQWLQFKVVLNSLTLGTTSFCRLKELRLR
jgi:hypothetical protein